MCKPVINFPLCRTEQGPGLASGGGGVVVGGTTHARLQPGYLSITYLAIPIRLQPGYLSITYLAIPISQGDHTRFKHHVPERELYKWRSRLGSNKTLPSEQSNFQLLDCHRGVQVCKERDHAPLALSSHSCQLSSSQGRCLFVSVLLFSALYWFG